MSTTFNIHYDVVDMQGKNVLVFLKPIPPERNYRIRAWHVLTGSAGSTESFEYDNVISTDVTSAGDDRESSITSGRMVTQPHQLLRAISPNGLSPRLEPAPTALANEKLTPSQCGVINSTVPFIEFDCNWYVNDRPVVTQPDVDADMTCTFEYEPNFYFMVAAPPMIGQSYTIQNFSDMTQFTLPLSATTVDVHLTREQGVWTFSFVSSS